MPTIENNTPFSAVSFGMLDAHAREYLVLVVAASFVVAPGGRTEIAPVQPEISPTDAHYGDPIYTSVRMPGQMCWVKPACDVLMTGSVISPGGRPTEQMAIGMELPGLRKALVATGDRSWRAGWGGRSPSAPRPFETLPVVYERAFGGGARSQPTDLDAAFEPRNPVGVGLAGSVASNPAASSELPNFEYFDNRQASVGERIRPAGFGAIAPGWQPRLALAGTYDAAWLQSQAPLLPGDFNSAFFQVAPTDQQVAEVRSGDPVRIVGMTHDGPWNFCLPDFDVAVTLLYRDRVELKPLRIDTVHFEPNRYLVHLAARCAVLNVLNRAPLDVFVVGAVAPGRLRARFAGKRYQGRGRG